jgi:hypothetical protein
MIYSTQQLSGSALRKKLFIAREQEPALHAFHHRRQSVGGSGPVGSAELDTHDVPIRVLPRLRL